MDAPFASYALVGRVATPVALAAWPVALALVLLLGRGLRGLPRAYRGPVLAVLLVSLAAHLLDTGLTLHITPDLRLEANPLWQAILRLAGLDAAIAWGLTGKVLVAVLHAECWAHYLLLREGLYPHEAPTFGAFLASFGGRGFSTARLRAFLAFVAGGFGPYFFYISALNAVGGVWEDFALYDRMPDPFVAAFLWGMTLSAGFYLVSWAAFRPASRAS